MGESEKPEPKSFPWLEFFKAAPNVVRDFAILVPLGYAFLVPNALKDMVCTSGLSEIGLFGLTAKANCTIEKESAKSLPPDAPVSAVVVQQVAQAQQANPGSIPSAGWLFLGQRETESQSWKSGSPRTIEPIPLPIATGARVIVRDDAYLRDDTASGPHSSARIVSVARVGERYQVISTDEARTVSGGDPFVWARVTRVE